jgi:hypothetical protein
VHEEIIKGALTYVKSLIMMNFRYNVLCTFFYPAKETVGDSQYCLLIDDQPIKSFVWYRIGLEEGRASGF